MLDDALTRKTAGLAAIAAIAATIALGVMLRLEDPLSTDVIPAEDPYTHMALVRDHVGDGDIEPLYEGSTLYPPGMHAVIAAYWSFSGGDLYDIFRVGPAVLGAISILGVAILLTRWIGVVAGFVGALALALAPEAIFRSTMMAPTAFDLAVLPYFLYASLEVLRGRLAWLGIAVPVAAYFVISHPWIVAILGPVVLALIVLAILLPSSDRAGRMAVGGAAAVLLTAGLALGSATMFCTDQCGLDFGEVTLSELATGLDLVTLIIAATCAVGAALLLVFRNRVAALHDHLQAKPWHWSLRMLASLIAAGFIVGLAVPAVAQGMPEFVDLPRMFGWPILVLAGLGMVFLPWASNPVAQVGTALAAVTYPFVLFNPFDSEFWPHRTAVFLGLGMVILAGFAVSGIARLAVAGWQKLPAGSIARPYKARPLVAGAIVSLTVTLGLGGAVYAATPDAYEGGWYRLYPECEFDALRSIAEDADRDAVIITGSWQGKLVLSAFAADQQNVWYMFEVFLDDGRRDATLRGLHLDGHDVIVVVERHMLIERPEIDPSVMERDPWVPLGSWCSSAIPEPRVKAYIAEVPQ